jgi:hypothetical protein
MVLLAYLPLLLRPENKKKGKKTKRGEDEEPTHE